MAASDEDDSQSDNKNDDSATCETSIYFSTIHQEIENQLNRPGVSYETRVSAVLSGWERLTGTVAGVSLVQPLATYLYRWSLRLILQGEWPALVKIVKTRLGVILQRCSSLPILQPLCRTLLPLVSDPWGQTKSIFANTELQDEEAISYISNESWEVVRVRVDTMIESKCEKLAFSVLKVCIRCIRLRLDGMEVPLYTDEDHNHFVDLYFVLLYKFDRKDFLEEVKALDVNEGVDLVRRLVAKQDKAKVWKHRLKIADLAIQIFLATTIVKKYSQDFWSVFLEWCGVQKAAEVADDRINQMIHKYMQLSESSQHMYNMSSILHRKFGNQLASLVTELLIRALTMDMNSLEVLKLKKAEVSKDEQLQLEQQMADGFMDLGTVFSEHKGVARECILTAFSLHPTSERIVLLNNFVNEANEVALTSQEPGSYPSLFDTHFSPHHLISSPISPTVASPHPSSSQQPSSTPHHQSPNMSSSPVHQSSLPSSSSPSHTTTTTTSPVPHHASSLPLTLLSSSPHPSIPSLQSSSVLPSSHKSSSPHVSSTTHETCKEEHTLVGMSHMSLQSSPASTTLPTSDTLHIHTVPPSFQASETVPDQCTTPEISRVCEVQGNTSYSEYHIPKHNPEPGVPREAPRDGEYELQITMDTGQSGEESTGMSFLGDSQESQMSDASNAQVKTMDVDLSQAKDKGMCDEVSEDNNSLPKIKDEVDSMDKFYKSTEHFIEQLSQEPPSNAPQSSELTNVSQKLLDPNYDILTHPNQVLDADELGLSKELCDDLAVVLSSPRWQVLSWKREWHELSSICDHYLRDADSAKNTTKELKYLNIDYSQFRNMPSAEITEFTGIEKGYEHFIEQESESDYSDDENTGSRLDPESASKRARGRPCKYPKGGDMYDSDSDGPCYMMPVSDSDSDEETQEKTKLKRIGPDRRVIEGKRVTAISNQDRRKRIRIDAETGKVRSERSLLNTLRLFRHQKYGGETTGDDKFDGSPTTPSHLAPPLSSINLIPRVVLTERDKSSVDQVQQSATTVMSGRGRAVLTSSQPRASWRYVTSLVAPSNPATTSSSTTSSVTLPRSNSVQCYYRSKDGKIQAASYQRTFLANSRPPNPGGNNNYLKTNNKPTSGYDDSYAKFLQQQVKGKEPPNQSRKSRTLDASLDYLKKQGTTVTFKTHKSGTARALINAQKNVLNRIMSPENAISAISNRTEIAMPVSNNPPNMPPSDKSNPTNIGRTLPKGTTVVRKTKPDGAGPSGISNSSGSSSSSSGTSARTVVTRPGTFSTVVSRPGVTVSTATVRAGSSLIPVRATTGTIRTTYARGILVSGSSVAAAAPEAVTCTSPVSTSAVASHLTSVGVVAAGVTVTTAMPAPLVSATVVGSVPHNNRSPPTGTLGGNNGKQQQTLQSTWDVAQSDNVSGEGSPSTVVSVIESNSSNTRGATTCTTTVASPPGDIRAASMLETLLRDRPVPPSPLLTQSTTAVTTITSALPSTITSIVGSSNLPIALSGESQVTNAVMGTLSSTGNPSNVVIASGSGAPGGVIMTSGVVGAPTGGVMVASGGIVGANSVGINSNVGENTAGAVQQVLVPGQLVQVHTSDGSTGLGIVHSSSLDLRLPAGTRVIKSCSGAVRTTVPQQQPVTGVINQTGGRQVNVLHNVKILQNLQNRQIVRTVVVPHPLQGLNTSTGQFKPQVLALTQGTSTAVSVSGESGVLQPQGTTSTVRAKIPSSTIVQKIGRNSLVIRTLRPQQSSTQTSSEAPTLEEGLGAKLNLQQLLDGDKSSGTTPVATNVTVARMPQDEGLGERLSHYLKTALASTTSTQSVGTQTLTTAVKPSAGQSVNQVALNNLRSAGGSTITLSGTIQGVPGTSSTIVTSPTSSQQANLSSLPLTPTNAVSSETLEQLREFESVFEKVSNKSGKDDVDTETSAESFSNTTVSSEESMIAAQLLSMANDTPTATTSNSYVYSVPTTVYEAGGTRLTEGTFITIPSTTQAGTLILVNHSGSGTGLVTVTSGVQSQQQQQQPPTAASPTLSSTSSHSSIASSPSSTSSKSKKTPPKPKVIPPAAAPVVAKPKTPPPPKAPAPKPTVAKPQVEESDETKARIQAILERYKLDLANTPQPQPAPRNRKNCPPPKNEGKSSNKKKSPVKKVDGAGNSPAVSEGSAVGCPSPSPSPGPASDNSAGLSGSTPGPPTPQFSSQGSSTPGTAVITEDKIKVETSPEIVATAPPQILQGVVVSNVKVEGSLSNTVNTLSHGLPAGRVVQLIRHGSKVTAITTRPPLNKIKTVGQGGPPNVTIQGRINMNDIMESQITSLLTGGSTTLNQAPTVVSKIVHHQQLTGPQTVQQVVLQAGQPLLQQVAVQQLPTTHIKQQQIQQSQHQDHQHQKQQEQQQLPQQQKCGVIQQLFVASNEEISSQPTQGNITHLQTSPPIATVTVANSDIGETCSKHIIVPSASSNSSTTIIATTPVITNAGGSSLNIVTSSGTPGPSPLSTVPSSPLTPQTSTVTSPPTPQPVIASPHTPSPATEPPTPSSFQMGEESNSSDHSLIEGIAGPLPPFFTLKSFIMQSPQQLSLQKQPPEQDVADKTLSSGIGTSFNQTGTTAPASGSSVPTPTSRPPQKAGAQTHIQLQISQLPRKPASVIRSGVSCGRRLIMGNSEGGSRVAGRGTAASSPLLTGSTGDTGITVSTMSSPSSLEGSPGTSQSRIRLATRPQDARSSSIDSLKSDLSVEEVQIPPSPATLTKQLQNAYMTEAALSPSVSQSQHSGSSYSSPSTTHDLTFTEAPPTSDDTYSSSLSHPGYSTGPSAPGLSVTGVSPEGDGQMTALASPSGDVYLHQSGTSLGLESLDAASLPLGVSIGVGLEVRTHSPVLSDLVSSGPLLTWSPRSADSIMVQSPSLNDALTANIPLDVNHSEDSLCDSSTAFPGLFSIEGDRVSVSSSTSEDIQRSTPGGVASNQHESLQQQEQESLEQEVIIDLHPRETEQDHTISSTRSPTQLELPVATLSRLSALGAQSAGGGVVIQGLQETPWRFDNGTGGQSKALGDQLQEPTNGHHSEKKEAIKEEDVAGPSDRNQGIIVNESEMLHPSVMGKREKGSSSKTQDDVKIVAEVASKALERERIISEVQNKPDGVVDYKMPTQESRKRSQRLASTTDRRKSGGGFDNTAKPEEIPTKNGHDENTDESEMKTEDNSSNVGRKKRRSSQRTVAPPPINQNLNRNRTKLKTEIKEEVDSELKNESLIKAEQEIKESNDEVVGRTTRGAKRRSEGDSHADVKCNEVKEDESVQEVKREDGVENRHSERESVVEVKRGRGTRSGRRSDGYLLTVDEEHVNHHHHHEDDCVAPRLPRSRHISGTSDTSSNYSLECGVSLGVHDTTNIHRRRRRHSRESSASSRDGSPTVTHTHDFPTGGGVSTRRASSRDHAKKKKCSCCVGGEQKKTNSSSSSTSGGGRRISARAARASTSTTPH